MSISSAQQQRLQWLQQYNAQKLQQKQEAMKQAAEKGVQYNPGKEKPNTKEVLENGGEKQETSIRRLSNLYEQMYNIRNNRPDLMENTDKVYKDIGYDSMSSQQKEIVDYFLGGKQF